MNLQVVKKHYPRTFTHFLFQCFDEVPELWLVYALLMKLIVHKPQAGAYATYESSSFNLKIILRDSIVMVLHAPLGLLPSPSSKHRLI